MSSGNRHLGGRATQGTGSFPSLEPSWCGPAATWRQRRMFQDTARTIIRLPAPEDASLDYLLSDAAWHRLVPPDNQEETVLTALSQATGVYFFPSRELVLALSRFCHLLGVRRVLEAGAGRGYLAAALAPLLAGQGIAFKAVDNGQGEFESGLPRHPGVETADALSAVQVFHPDLVLYAWPPPGQSVHPLCCCPSVRYVLVLGEAGGGCTGDPGDWQRLPYRSLRSLSRYGLGRSGRQRQAASLFFGACRPKFPAGS